MVWGHRRFLLLPEVGAYTRMEDQAATEGARIKVLLDVAVELAEDEGEF